MNCEELPNLLRNAGVPDNAYTIGEKYENEVYVIAREGTLWCVYYSERGLKTGLTTFSTEEAACQRLFDWIVPDSTNSQ